VKGIYVKYGRAQEKINYSGPTASVREHFNNYLSTYPAKTTRSKHGLLGPVGTVLREAKSDKWDAEGLTGYALSIHSNNPRTRGWIELASLSHLKLGVNELLALLGEAPVARRDGIIADIDYGLYLDRREAGLKYMHEMSARFAEFARRKYGTVEKASAAWGIKGPDIGDGFERMPYPSKNRFKTEAWQRDVSDFAGHLSDEALEDEEVAEEEIT